MVMVQPQSRGVPEFRELQEKVHEELMKHLEKNKQSAKSNRVEILSHTEDCPVVAFNVERCGAYDNYYNHNISNGSFTIQALLEGQPHQYVRITGNVSNKTNTGTVLGNYKTKINGYDKYTQKEMEGAHWTEVAGWATALAAAIAFIAGSTGPAGWAAYTAGQFTYQMLSIFIGLTSVTYATYTRLSYSRTAAIYQKDAMDIAYSDMLLGMHWHPTGGSDFVNGF